MKTILRPARIEQTQYSCDVTGVPLPHGPAAIVTLHCGFGALYDGDTFAIDLSDTAAGVVIPLLRALLLDGGTLQPHRTDSLFPAARRDAEQRISARGRVKLLRRLDHLRDARRKSERAARKPPAPSATGRTRVRSKRGGGTAGNVEGHRALALATLWRSCPAVECIDGVWSFRGTSAPVASLFSALGAGSLMLEEWQRIIHPEVSEEQIQAVFAVVVRTLGGANW